MKEISKKVMWPLGIVLYGMLLWTVFLTTACTVYYADNTVYQSSPTGSGQAGETTGAIPGQPNIVIITSETKMEARNDGALGTQGGVASVAGTLTDILAKYDPKITNTETTTPVPLKPDTPIVVPEKPVDPDAPVVDPIDPATPDDGTTGPAKAILWKPVADSGGKLVVLLPADMGTPEVSVLNADQTLNEKGDFVYLSNPNRATYRFKKAGKDFPNPCFLKVGSTLYKVSNPAARHESLPSYTPAG